MLKKIAFPISLLCIVLWLILNLSADPTHPAGAEGDPTPTPLPDPVPGMFDLSAVTSIDLTAYPIIPEISDTARQIYENGLAQGNNPQVFAKIGDCMTDNPYFLIPIGEEQYDLGEYTALAPVIEQFASDDLNSFSRRSQAAAGGFNAASVLDSLWANPEFCEAGETPLACELRLAQPSIAVVMFGTNDVFYLTEDQFDFFLRSIIVQTVRNGTLPLMSTFPHRPEFPEKSLLYNQIVAQIATDYDVPLINLWQALSTLPNQGVDPVETTHLSTPADGAVCAFIGDNLQAGFTVRNLLTLQTLDAVLQAVAQP
jgi:hypothetical protein